DIVVNYQSAKAKSLEDAIISVLRGTGLEFKMFDERFVIIYQKDPEGITSLRRMVGHMEKIIEEDSKSALHPVSRLPLRDHFDDPFRQASGLVLNISGKVTDDQGEPLIGVNVQVKGTTKGTATDFEGQFELEDVNENAVLVFSYIGYQTVEIPLDARRYIAVTMIADSELLDEVVVVGYGTQKKVNVTGAITSVSDEYMHSRPGSTVSQLLQGQSSGVDLGVS